VEVRKAGLSGFLNAETRVIFEFTSSIPGLLALPPLTLRIYGGEPFSVPFESATLINDPLHSAPILSLRPDSNARAEVGKPFRLTLFVRNAAAVTGLNLDLSKDALFSITERLSALDTVSGMEASLYSDIPLARLEWLPLETGNLQIPKVHVNVRSFAGIDSAVSTAAFTVTVVPALETETATPKPIAMPYPAAFDDVNSPDKESATTSAGDADAVIQAALGFARAELRKSVRLFVVFIAVSAVLLGAVIVTVVSRKYRMLIPAALFLVITAIGSVYYGKQAFRADGIFTGSEIKAVPEFSSSAIAILPPGTRLSVLKTGVAWYYVATNETTGWVPAETVHLVK
jgi:hypothetical protein